MKLRSSSEWHEDLGASIFVSFSMDDKGNVLGEPPELQYGFGYLEDNFDFGYWTHFIDGDFSFIFSDADPDHPPTTPKQTTASSKSLWNTIESKALREWLDVNSLRGVDESSALAKWVILDPHIKQGWLEANRPKPNVVSIEELMSDLKLQLQSPDDLDWDRFLETAMWAKLAADHYSLSTPQPSRTVEEIQKSIERHFNNSGLLS